MSATELPDDPWDWPSDPFDLLGVERGAADADLKRAYTRLIRRFKPEHHPEQFRRIREAYEECRSQSSWYYPFAPEGSEPAAASGRTSPAEPETVRTADEADRLWGEAVAGREREAYAGLVELARSRPDRADVSLRLYWLLALDPDLEPERTRHDWLAEALVRSRLRGPAAELYRRELEVDPCVTLYGPYKDLLAAAEDEDDLLPVVRWRVAAAGRTSRYYLLADDLRAVRDRVVGRGEASWLSLLMAAADWAAWAPPGDLPDLCRAELASLRHLELSHAHWFDRLEESTYVAAAGQEAELQHVPDRLVDLVRVSWCGYGEARPADVYPAVADVAADPVQNLSRFDRLIPARGSGFLTLVIRALEQFRRLHGPADGPPFPPDLVRGLARRLAVGGRLAEYAYVRPSLLRLLIDEAIDPLEFAAAFDVDPEYRYRGMANYVHGDLSLRAVWLAAHLHRG